ncbi:hypothetical protein QNK09_09105 [Brevibacillus agri]|nr:hypothetical protein [Brevibacillus agri]WHX33456.1 hypothetical protein QNK09_09105 [Brevibacillus agri]
MLASTLFEVLPQSISTISSGTKNNYPIGRVTMVARAISGRETAADSYAELLRIYRNPGLVPDYL